jgi:hypothetical protein
VPLAALAHRDSFDRYVVARFQPAFSEIARIIHSYAFKHDERDFAAQLLAQRTQLWLFRSHQAAFCGDFMIVDLSVPRPDKRPVWVVELKSSRPLLVREGAVGVQLQRAHEGLAELEKAGLVAKDCAWNTLLGSREAVLSFFGV